MCYWGWETGSENWVRIQSLSRNRDEDDVKLHGSKQLRASGGGVMCFHTYEDQTDNKSEKTREVCKADDVFFALG